MGITPPPATGYDELARLTGTTLVTSSGAVRNAHGYQLNLGHQRTNQVFTNTTLSLTGERKGYTCGNENGGSYLRSDTADGLAPLTFPSLKLYQ